MITTTALPVSTPIPGATMWAPPTLGVSDYRSRWAGHSVQTDGPVTSVPDLAGTDTLPAYSASAKPISAATTGPTRAIVCPKGAGGAMRISSVQPVKTFVAAFDVGPSVGNLLLLPGLSISTTATGLNVYQGAPVYFPVSGPLGEVIISGRLEGSSLSVRFGLAQPTTLPAGNFATATAAILQIGPNATTAPHDTRWYDVAVWDRALSDSEMTTVISRMAAIHGVTV